LTRNTGGVLPWSVLLAVIKQHGKAKTLTRVAALAKTRANVTRAQHTMTCCADTKPGANRGGARGLAWELTDEQFFAMTQSNCTYCGVPPVRPFVYKGEERFEYNGVDRVDSSKGYTPANCVPCCEICNKAKRDLPLAAFEVWLRRVAAYWQDRNIPVTFPGIS
jgi:5-methylcytosine-specific restriction endonuclease McrA